MTRPRPSLGEQIARRLQDQHGVVFVAPLESHQVVRDQGAIIASWRDGMDYCVWWLGGPSGYAQIQVTHAGEEFVDGWLIGSTYPASYLVRCPEWELTEIRYLQQIQIDPRVEPPTPRPRRVEPQDSRRRG